MSTSAVLLQPVRVPETYHRILSPFLRFPEYPAPIPVGLLACQRNPLLRELQTRVVSVKASQPLPTQQGKKKRGNTVDTSQASLVEAVLHDTVLFPEGGGQPSDIGHLQLENGIVVDVLEIKRQGGIAVHFVDASLSDLSPGSPVTVYLGDDGFKRRYDHMTIHTSQHLFSAVIETQLNLPTLSWSLTAWPLPCYVEIPRALTPEEINLIQETANTFVREGRQVHVEVENFMIPEEADETRKSGSTIPTDYTGGILRTIVIDGIDKNPCCGTHLPTLNNLQLFILPQQQSLARGTGRPTSRLSFLAGPRLLEHVSTSHSLLSSSASTLSCGAPLVPERVVQMADERRRAEKRVEDLESETANMIAKKLLTECNTNEKSLWIKHLHRSDDSKNTRSFLSAISLAFTSAMPERSSLLVLTSSPSIQNSNSTTTVFFTSSDESVLKRLGDALKAGKADGLRIVGGGKGPIWSGKFTGVWKQSKEGQSLEDLMKDVCGGNA